MRLLLAFLVSLSALPALACGPDSDCVVGDRTYRLYVPEAAPQPMPVLLFAHGYRGSAAAEMRNKALLKMADDMGIAIVAMKSAEEDWALAHTPQAPERPDAMEYDYVDAVLADVAGRVKVDADRIVMSGFSAGGMMTWTMACGMADRFRGFVPMSGTFWAPVPETCDAPPRNLVHIHGTEDTTVPLNGRAIGATRQGEVERALAIYAQRGGFSRKGDVDGPDGMTCRQATNADSRILDFCTFKGGHGFSVARLRYGIEQVLAAPPP
ncbi:MAG: polyhydroxybutyrate depolymerase [Tabrizicola sp.]|nr:polyhydroxybutyrate depolymerase [Tabrizicola sp.]